MPKQVANGFSEGGRRLGAHRSRYAVPQVSLSGLLGYRIEVSECIAGRDGGRCSILFQSVE